MTARTSNFSATERIERARLALAASAIDGLLVTPGVDLHYLTGYDAVALERLTCLVLTATGTARLVVPRLEQPAAEASPVGALDLEIVPWEEVDDPYALVAGLLPSTGRIAVDDHMWAAKVLAFRDAMPEVTQVRGGEVVAELRLRKSADEVAALREVAAAIDRVHDRMGEWLRVGRTERAVGADIAAAIVAEGHAQADFVIVGSGPNGASPHHGVSDREIAAGDAVVVDIGGTSTAGYCSDSTRTYVVGTPVPAFRDYYDVLQRAQEAGCTAVRPGATAESVDAAARTVIADAGYGDYFIHRTGHGIGLETHEEPYIVAGNERTLEPGMAFSIEPGIYLPGRHGARIEDIVVVTDTGVERLNQTTRDLVALPG